MKTKVTAANGGFCSTLTLIFIVLRLTDHIDWSWWWVLAPLWIPIATVLSIGFVAGLIVIVLSVFVKKPTRRTGSLR